MALTIGIVSVVLLGLVHQLGLTAIHSLTQSIEKRRRTAIFVSFTGLLALHLAEILAFAVVYRGLLAWGALGGLGDPFDGSWGGLIYFSGINFTTLGYTQIPTTGPMRLVNMMQALGGFMVLTWSATFIFQVWNKAFTD